MIQRLDVPRRWNDKRGYRPKEHYCTARTYPDRADICAFGTSCNRLAKWRVDEGWQGHRLCTQHAIQVAGREAVERAK